MPNNRDDVKRVFENIFSIKCYDALAYDLSSLEVIDITEFKEYHGVHVSIMAYLDRTKAPVAAVREAIINSFGHKLFEAGQANEVAVYRDRIEIYSPGEFPRNHSPESFVKENKALIRRNALITRTLYYSQDM